MTLLLRSYFSKILLYFIKSAILDADLNPILFFDKFNYCTLLFYFKL